MGTITLLNVFKEKWINNWNDKRFYHISTDEVYGSLGETGLFHESTPIIQIHPTLPRKLVLITLYAYGETYGLPYLISNCSNNYGQNQIS